MQSIKDRNVNATKQLEKHKTPAGIKLAQRDEKVQDERSKLTLVENGGPRGHKEPLELGDVHSTAPRVHPLSPASSLRSYRLFSP